MKNVYPTIFTNTGDCYLVEVPDLNILTEGKDLNDAIEMARDAIGLAGISMEDHGEVIPEPSSFDAIKPESGTFADDGNGIVSMVDIDFQEYRRKTEVKTVRRNVTLPNWLNVEAEKAHLNVSKVLQEALMTKLNVQR